MRKESDLLGDEPWQYHFNSQQGWLSADLRLDPARDWASHAEAVQQIGIDAVLLGELVAGRKVRQVFIYESTSRHEGMLERHCEHHWNGSAAARE